MTIDKSGANTATLATLNADKPAEENITVRQSKYLNNLVEQDHRNIKRRIRQMLTGIELLHMIRKGQYQHPQSDELPTAERQVLAAMVVRRRQLITMLVSERNFIC